MVITTLVITGNCQISLTATFTQTFLSSVGNDALNRSRFSTRGDLFTRYVFWQIVWKMVARYYSGKGCQL